MRQAHRSPGRPQRHRVQPTIGPSQVGDREDDVAAVQSADSAPATSAVPATTWPFSVSLKPCAATSDSSASPRRTRSYSALAGAVTILFRRWGADLSAARLQLVPSGNSARSPGYTCTIPGPEGRLAWTATTVLALPTTLDSAVVFCAEFLIKDTAAWAAALGYGWDTQLAFAPWTGPSTSRRSASTTAAPGRGWLSRSSPRQPWPAGIARYCTGGLGAHGPRARIHRRGSGSRSVLDRPGRYSSRKPPATRQQQCGGRAELGRTAKQRPPGLWRIGESVARR